MAEESPRRLSDQEPKHTRLWDLVRFARGYLSDQGLISNEEYADLVAGRDGSAAARRLETYDELRNRLTIAEATPPQRADVLAKLEKLFRDGSTVSWSDVSSTFDSCWPDRSTVPPSPFKRLGLAERIVKSIVADLSTRRGLRQEWEAIHPSVRQEIITTWITVADEQLHSNV